jgi:hypothetical protein
MLKIIKFTLKSIDKIHTYNICVYNQREVLKTQKHLLCALAVVNK